MYVCNYVLCIFVCILMYVCTLMNVCVYVYVYMNECTLM